MSESEKGDLSALAYPGFVDILSSVVIMFVFFVLVIASALYFHIIIFKSKILSSVQETVSAQSEVRAMAAAAEATQDLAKENEELKKQIKEITQKMDSMEYVETEDQTKLYQEKSQFAESKEQKVTIESSTKTLIVFFGEDSISLTPDSTKELQEALASYYADISSGGYSIKVLAAKSPTTFETAARKLALARMLNVRNVLLGKINENDLIIPQVVDSEEIDGSHQWVKIIFEDKP